ncbi:uncharacterized protein LOC115741052 [Rhodamnia argentea]|uniref:Protein cereblon n=1 Tax=Rhodamnia argentea TaxID=178133 RepID=A0A8B8P9I5_9MYRT|nr:uncharacterized protein LOC115741052 [Rhodamnia argentea]
MEDRSIIERERHQIEQIRELDFEELQVEEVEDAHDSSDDDRRTAVRDGASVPIEFTFNPSLASLHTYLGEVEDTHHSLAFLDGGAIHQLPLLYLEGVVLFPEATLPLRVVQRSLIATIERALSPIDRDTPLMIGVVRIYSDPENNRLRFATTGTTAEIRQYRRLEDGSLNAVTRGQQRFRLKRCWIDAEGVACGEVQIIQEDLPLRTPRDAFGKLPRPSVVRDNYILSNPPENSPAKSLRFADEDDDSEAHSENSFESALSLPEHRLHQSAIDCSYGYDVMDESTSSDDEKFVCESEFQEGRSHSHHHSDEKISGNASGSGGQSHKGSWGWTQRKAATSNYGIPRAFWPHWVYRMYDSYCLAQRVADMWKQIVGAPAMDGLVKKPDLLSFYVASKIPVSQSTRQELLDIDGVTYRLRREIELLECFDRIQCKSCQTVIARRSDMMVMSSDGPLGAYVNPHGSVHEIMTLHKANGLALIGRPNTDYSWFPGYAWTITNCATCESHMGWLFTATNNKLKPRLFWGIRSSQVADSNP